MRTLRRGDRGREVVDLQTRLQALGFDLGNRGIDGVFRERTELAVRAFQQRLGLLADGLVGPITWREIVEAGYRPGGRLLYLRQPPFRGADVVELQQMLDDLGFDPCPPEPGLYLFEGVWRVPVLGLEETEGDAEYVGGYRRIEADAVDELLDLEPPEVCCVCAKPATTHYDDREDSPSCGSPACELTMQQGLDYHDEAGHR